MALRPGSKTRARVRVVSDGEERRRGDYLATEEPLEIRLAGGGRTERLAVTMRTPGNDFELAAGFLHGEGESHHAEHPPTSAHHRRPSQSRTSALL